MNPKEITSLQGSWWHWPGWIQLCCVLTGGTIIAHALFQPCRLLIRRRNRRLEQEADDQAESLEVEKLIDDDFVPFSMRIYSQDLRTPRSWQPIAASPIHIPKGIAVGYATRPKEWNRASSVSASASDISALGMDEPQLAHVKPPELALTSKDDNTGPDPQNVAKRNKANSVTISYSGPSIRSQDESYATAVAPPPVSPPAASIPKLRLKTSPKRVNTTGRKFVIGGRSNSPQQMESLRPKVPTVIGRMDAHMRLQSAETSKLQARTRWSTTAFSREFTSMQRNDENDPSARALTLAAGSEESLRIAGNSPQRAQRRTSPAPVPFRALVESRPPPKAPPSAWTSRTQGLLDEKLGDRRMSRSTSAALTPSLCSSTTLDILDIVSDIGSLSNTTSRKVNGGFEVLPAGHFDKEPEAKILGFWPESKQKAATQRIKSKKLQKRNRSVSVSSGHSGSSRSLYELGARHTLL